MQDAANLKNQLTSLVESQHKLASEYIQDSRAKQPLLKSGFKASDHVISLTMGIWSGLHDNFAQSENLTEAVEKFVSIEEKSYSESFGMDTSIKAIVKHIFDEFRVKLSEILSQDPTHNDFAIHILRDGNLFVRNNVERDIREEAASVSKS